tara:strand:+ start:4373 stop:5776 length:1404 start_codon:yes stop_codon:yes gene_type:complete
MVNIIINEWKILLRNRAIMYITTVFVLSLIAIVWISIFQNNNQKDIQLSAEKHIRNQWDNLKPMNPHRAAHYGSYVFKPISVLNSLDDGISSITGNVLKLEGHIQNEIVYSEASQSISISKFGKLKSSLVLQYVIPLFLIFLAFSSVSSEKETGRLKLLIFQGISLFKLIFSKSISIWLYGVFLLFITITIQALFSTIDLETIQRLIFIFVSYGCYYFIISCLTTYFSSACKNNTSALSSILATWIIWTIFLPKIWGNAVEKIYPLPSRQNFKSIMKEDRAKGIDGHNPSDQRREQLKNKYLVEYNVDSLKQLPINFDGIVMQADEEYGNLVWDKHFGNNYSIFQKQKRLYQISGLLNPFSSLQNLSMGFCGNDMIHHLDFLKKAEEYRRYLVKTLNDKHAFGGSKTGNWKWSADNTFFRSVEKFEYKTPKIEDHIGHYVIDIFFLLFWVMITTLLIRLYTNKNILL